MVKYEPYESMGLMKTLCAAFLLLAVGCSTPGTTEINRPPPDVNGSRQLLLTTSFNPNEGATLASAAYSDSSVSGFGAGVFITCNGVPIIDTRTIAGEPDSERFISISTDYLWSYSGPDTSFLFDMPSPGQMQITEPRQDTEIFQFLSTDSLHIIYEPAGSCSNIIVTCIGFHNGTGTEDTVRPMIQFDTTDGTIHPIPLPPFATLAQNGQGTLSITKISSSIFSIPSIHTIVIADSTKSQPFQILFE